MQNIINLIGMMCFWSGIFNIFEKTSTVDKVSNVINKFISKLFNKRYLNDKAAQYMSLNITTNILGVGNASTINGIRAMEEMQKDNLDKDSPNDNMTTFMVINAASLQLIPTSMITLRAMYNSTDPSAILIPVWIVTLVALISGLIMIKLLNRWVK
ncbi:Spore maturation protein A [compost metagenome]